jgi:ring-1,2-phenylacetyl-CoA epoxidase subunit PaaC
MNWHVTTLLRLADNALIMAQRISEWCGHGPILEEDIAMANISLDLLGQARFLYSHAGKLENQGRDEDALAYFRDALEYRNWSFCELPNSTRGKLRHDDYAVTIARNLLYTAYALPLWQALGDSSDLPLAAIANKAIKETQAHWRHSRDWSLRLGDGNSDSKARMQAALDFLWPYTKEWFLDDDADQAAANAGVQPLPSGLRKQWLANVAGVLAQADLRQPAETSFQSAGKRGQHTEHLSYLLAEMQSIARAHPGATW